MKSMIAGVVLALLATPAAAQQAAAVDRPTLDRPAAETRPATDRIAPRPRPDHGDKAPYIAALRKAQQRAKNAVANGANPARVRAKLQAYKQKLRRRWNATH